MTKRKNRKSNPLEMTEYRVRQVSKQLKETLLKHGGKTVKVERRNPYDKLIIAQGELQTEVFEDLEMQPNRCHQNAAIDWLISTGMSYMHGYAMCEESGVWVCHSWLAAGDAVIETCGGRDKYFGYRFSTLETIKMIKKMNPLLLTDFDAALEQHDAEEAHRLEFGDLARMIKKAKLHKAS